jgi:diguanylate cyclase (GGDEF)-like protein
MSEINIIISGLMAGMCLAAITALARFTRSSVAESASRIAELEQKLKNSKSEFENLGRIDNDIKERELLLVSLYEFTKKMSHGLRFDEIYKALVSFLDENLKETFAFKKGELIVLKELNDVYDIDRVYEFFGPLAAPSETAGLREAPAQKSASSAKKSPYDFQELLKLCMANKKGIFIERRESEGTFSALKVPDDVETVAVMPLMHENKIIAILAVQEMPRQNFDKFAIIAIQLALQMKKVLLYETVESLAITDGLTALYARRYFLERLEEELKRSKAHNLTFSFLMADIDHFKACNDTYGHLVGDVVLKEIGRIIKESVREIDLVARYGGEEFSVILPETRKELGGFVAQRIRKRIEESVFRAYDESLKITISIGVSAYPDDGQTARALIDSSDKAMYKAKADGRNLVRVFEKEARNQ